MQPQPDTGIAGALRSACRTGLDDSPSVEHHEHAGKGGTIRITAMIRHRLTAAGRRLGPATTTSPPAAMLRSAFGCLDRHGFSAIRPSMTENTDGTTEIDIRATAHREATNA